MKTESGLGIFRGRAATIKAWKTIRDLRPDIPYDEIVLTFDVDGAPDEVIQYTVDLVREHGARATFFATHASPLLRDLAESRDLEVGIHPNYFSSTDFERQVDELMACYPRATSIRGHGLYTSTAIQALYAAKGITHCVDAILPYHPGLRPVWRFTRGGLILVPYFWEDGHALWYLDPPEYHLDPAAFPTGLKVCNFHPVLVFTNTSDYRLYEQRIRPDTKDVAALRALRGERGAATMLRSLLSGLTKSPR